MVHIGRLGQDLWQFVFNIAIIFREFDDFALGGLGWLISSS